MVVEAGVVAEDVVPADGELHHVLPVEDGFLAAQVVPAGRQDKVQPVRLAVAEEYVLHRAAAALVHLQEGDAVPGRALASALRDPTELCLVAAFLFAGRVSQTQLTRGPQIQKTKTKTKNPKSIRKVSLREPRRGMSMRINAGVVKKSRGTSCGV